MEEFKPDEYEAKDLSGLRYVCLLRTYVTDETLLLTLPLTLWPAPSEVVVSYRTFHQPFKFSLLLSGPLMVKFSMYPWQSNQLSCPLPRPW